MHSASSLTDIHLADTSSGAKLDEIFTSKARRSLELRLIVGRTEGDAVFPSFFDSAHVSSLSFRLFNSRVSPWSILGFNAEGIQALIMEPAGHPVILPSLTHS
jgi:hypothetical protein